MFPVTSYKDKNIAVFGLGRSGITASLALMAGGANVFAWDDNEQTRAKAKEQNIPLKDFREFDFSKIEALIMSPGIAIYGPKINWAAKLANDNDVPIIGDIELFAREINAIPHNFERPKVVGITGTNGKSTTTALIAHILQNAGKYVQMGGNIGTGILSLSEPRANAFYVLELSSYQLDLTTSLHLDAAILINISEDHLERHGSMKRYFEAKKNIFNNQTANDTAIIGVDDEWGEELCTQLLTEKAQKIVPISSGQFVSCGVSCIDNRLWDNTSGRAEEVADLSLAKALPGKHNGQNAAAAFAACKALGLSSEIIAKGIYNFGGLKHRLQKIGTIGNVTFYNDSKATNADASAQALAAFPKLRWLAGGQAKTDGIDPLVGFFPKITKSYLFGDAAQRFAGTLGEKNDYQIFEGLEEALKTAFADAVKSGENELIVLSPACASWDQYTSFEARGDHFIEIFEQLNKEFSNHN